MKTVINNQTNNPIITKTANKNQINAMVQNPVVVAVIIQKLKDSSLSSGQ